MGAAKIGIVDDVDIARLRRQQRHLQRPLDHGLGRALHGTDKNRQAKFALGAQFAGLAVIDAVGAVERSEERRVVKECVGTCSSRWCTDHLKKKNTATVISNSMSNNQCN